jgi:hypothetical protein
LIVFLTAALPVAVVHWSYGYRHGSNRVGRRGSLTGSANPEPTKHPDGGPFVGSDSQWVVRIDVAHQAVNRFFFFRGESSEKTIPDDEYTSVVSVQVGDVASVVYPMVAGGIKQPFDGPPELINGFGMNPKLIDEAEASENGYHDGMKA